MNKRQSIGRGVLAVCVILGAVAIASRVRHTERTPTTGGSQEDQLVIAAEHPLYAAKEGELRSRGIPVRLSELATPDTPPSINAGPLYLQMVDAQAYPGSPLEDEAVRVTGANPPADAWVSARKLMGTQPRLVETSNRAGLLPDCHVNRSLDGDPQAVLFPEVAQMGRATRIITVESLLKAREGHPVEAVGLQSEGFTIANHARGDVGLLFSSFVALECDATTLDGMQGILRGAKGAPEVAQAVDGALAKSWHAVDPSVALMHETASGNSEIRYLESKGPGALPANAPLGQALSRDQRYWDGFIDINGTFYLDLMEQSVAAARLPYPQLMRELSTVNRERAEDPGVKGMLAGLLYPQVSGYCSRCFQISAKAAVTRAACAVFLYKSKQGHYPVTLSEADPTAIDPFVGTPLGYRREGKGFVVYSAGPTGEYDGGAFDAEKRHEEAFRYTE